MAEKEFLDALISTVEVELIVKTRTGRSTSRPVWFVLEGEMLYLLPVVGSDTKWYQQLLLNSQITLAVRGKRASPKAKPLSDPAEVSRVVELFRRKHGRDVEKFYSKFDAAVAVRI